MSDIIEDFVGSLLQTVWPMGAEEYVRIVDVDTSGLRDSPPVLTVRALIGGRLNPKRWRLALRLASEDVVGLSEPSYRQAMATVVIPANIMEWWQTKDGSVVVSSQEEAVA